MQLLDVFERREPDINEVRISSTDSSRILRAQCGRLGGCHVTVVVRFWVLLPGLLCYLGIYLL